MLFYEEIFAGEGSFQDVVVNMLDYDIEVSEFEQQPSYYVGFQTNTLSEKYETPYPSSYVFLQ